MADARCRRSRDTGARPVPRSGVGVLMEMCGTEIPAARPLQQVAADRRGIANLRRGRVPAASASRVARADRRPPRIWASVTSGPSSRPSVARHGCRRGPIDLRFTTRAGRMMPSFIRSRRSMPPALATTGCRCPLREQRWRRPRSRWRRSIRMSASDLLAICPITAAHASGLPGKRRQDVGRRHRAACGSACRWRCRTRSRSPRPWRRSPAPRRRARRSTTAPVTARGCARRSSGISREPAILYWSMLAFSCSPEPGRDGVPRTARSSGPGSRRRRSGSRSASG